MFLIPGTVSPDVLSGKVLHILPRIILGCVAKPTDLNMRRSVSSSQPWSMNVSNTYSCGPCLAAGSEGRRHASNARA